MRKIYLLTLLLSLFSFSCSKLHREEQLFNDNWQFAIVPTSDSTLYTSALAECSEWESVSLPHNPHPEPLYVTNQWQGICWYRKSFDIDKFSQNRNYFLKFEAAMNFSQVWVNGVLLSEHNGGYLPVVVNISDVVKESDNIVAVRLDNQDNVITGPKPMKINGFQMYGGLYRNSWLYSTNKLYISDANSPDIDVASGGVFITYSKVAEELSVVDVKTDIVNSSSVSSTISVVQDIYYGSDLVSSTTSLQTIDANSSGVNSGSLEVKSAKLWSPSAPNLYRLKTTLLQQGDTIDVKTTRFGIRSFSFKGNDLYINGVKTFLRGVNRHQEYPFVGYALSDLAQYRDAQIIKDGGFDYIRLCHYPHSDAFMDACDSLGIVVIDAIMGWQYYGKTDAFQQHAFHSVRQLIRRDRNHPSVMAWEASLNETYMPTHFMERLHEVVHEESPYSGTYSCGWRHDPYDIYLQARQHRILHPKEVLFDKPYSVSEYGDWEYYSDKQGFNQHTYGNSKRLEMCSRQHRASGEVRMLQQARNVQEAHNDNLSIPAYSDSYWAMFDYNIGASDVVDAPGLMNILRLPKFAYHFYASQREYSPQNVQLTIASYWDKDSATDVRVFSNCDSVELLLNGKSIAIQSPDKDKYSTHLQHPPFTFKMGKFTSGSLQAIGYKDGKRVKECLVSTPKQPTQIKCVVDTQGYSAKAGCNDLLFVHAMVVDTEGTLCHNYTSNITFTLPANLELMNSDGVKTEAGVATALVRVGKDSGEYTILATSEDGLTGSVVMSVVD